MPNSKHTTYTFYIVHLPLLILLVLVVGGGLALTSSMNNDVDKGSVLAKKDSNGKSEDKGNNSNKDNSNKPDKTDKSNNSNKPVKPYIIYDGVSEADSVKNKSNQGQVHKKNVEEVVVALEDVVIEEDAMGNEQAGDEVEEVIEETEGTVDETTVVIENLEKRPKWKTLLFGTDYKNLGQLRSSLAHNENSIRKLNRTQTTLQSTVSVASVDDQMGALLLERERIRTIIQENESEFSILGWVTKFFSGYTDTGIEDDNGILDEIDDESNESSESTESTETPSVFDF